MNIPREQFENAAEKWAAIYEAVKDMEGVGTTMEQARKLLMKANPKITRDGTFAQMVVMEHNGYIEGVRDADGHMMKPMKVRITEKGHEFFREKIEQCQEMAKEMPTA